MERYVDAASVAATLRRLEERGRLTLTKKKGRSFVVERCAGGKRIRKDENAFEQELFREGPLFAVQKKSPLHKAVRAQTKVLAEEHKDAWAPGGRLKPWVMASFVVALAWIALAMSVESGVARLAVALVTGGAALGKCGGTWKDALLFAAASVPLAGGLVSFFGFADVFGAANVAELIATAVLVVGLFAAYSAARRWHASPTDETREVLDQLDAMKGRKDLPESWTLALGGLRSDPLFKAVKRALQVTRPKARRSDDWMFDPIMDSCEPIEF